MALHSNKLLAPEVQGVVVTGGVITVQKQPMGLQIEVAAAGVAIQPQVQAALA